MKYNKILLATDGSDSSIKAAKKVVEMEAVENYPASIEIFHAEKHNIGAGNFFSPFQILDGTTFVSSPTFEEQREEFRKFGEQVLNNTKKVFDEAGIKVKTTLVMDKSPEDYIKESVKEKGFDLIVLGAKGHHWKIRQHLMGSVCTNILNNADCDVLIVK
jgi:nucleotide-binding universal stress UspA family protein